MWGLAHLLRAVGDDMGFAKLVMWACGALYLACLAADREGVSMSGLLSFVAPSLRSLFLFGASGAVPVFGYHRWWTVLSAAWLHAGVLHIVFNMLWVRDLAPPVGAAVRPGADGDHLHGLRDHRLHREQPDGASCRSCRASSAAPASPSGPRRRSSGSSERFSTTAGAAAAR